MELLDPDLFRRLKAARNKSNARLAYEAGCSRAMVGHLATGYRTRVTDALAQRLAAALGVDASLLFRAEEPEQQAAAC